ncbi:MAG: hypothetical protein C4520_17000 [Candidatus Abyssobacteria bacterium SURF_5]|uniref:AdoMet activation domain-containing protein n=1 Tax=Abyssobacteria bacterium (strain SURF_5) TaxID=2093360 RepID=A0A3A4NEY4_ABYX5|nr:MAG: hypothetical protein C4520_17000 [Candidatus Abyssubacteria bacterium SURF_5]
MSSQQQIREVEVHIPLEDLLGPLGYKAKEQVTPGVMQQILEESSRCKTLLKPRFITDLIPVSRSGEASGGSDIRFKDEFLARALDGAQVLGLGICTVGPDIDLMIDDCFARGDYLVAMIADVVASRAVEEAGEACSDFLCAKASEQGLFPLCRISPGYGKWDVSGQRTLFSLLDPAPLGVSLNQYCMMQPKKSISFLIPLGENEPVQKFQPSCQECNFKKCAYRRRR